MNKIAGLCCSVATNGNSGGFPAKSSAATANRIFSSFTRSNASPELSPGGINRNRKSSSSSSKPAPSATPSIIIPNTKRMTQNREKLKLTLNHSQYSDSNLPKTSVAGIDPTRSHKVKSEYYGLHEYDENLSLNEKLITAYDEASQFCKSKKLPEDVDPHAVFACNRLNLRDIEVYGFDYDYTLACYRPEMEQLIYDLAREVLLNEFKYPHEIENLHYDPNFAVRGLHYDIQGGFLLKVDSFMQIQLGCVYRGLSPVPDDEVLEIYGSRKIPMKYIDEGPSQPKAKATTTLIQLSDLFSLPEMNLLCNVTEYLHKNNIDYTPESLFRDVKESVQSIHPVMHKIVANNPKKYLEYDPLLREYLTTLKDSGRKLFLITNSPFHFVDKGLNFILGEDWLNFFDVTVVRARKPYFFSNDTTPFRVYCPDQNTRLWDRVTKLERGKIYYGGTVKQFQAMTGWRGDHVLYFGDHPYSDLADLTLHHGWRTGAIIKELETEIDTLNRQDFKYQMNWVNFMTSLLETYQDLEDPEALKIIQEWQVERKHIRNKNKEIFNPQFGSMFRTHLNPTLFSKRLFRFADVYTSAVTNLMRYTVRHTFYPRRGALPHEYRSWFN